MEKRPGSPGTTSAGPWWLVLCLIGLDYFSTLAYLPSLVVQAVGPLAPLAAVVVVAVTWLAALPVYFYVVGRSPHGRGGTGLIEKHVPGWAGKLLILLLLSFVATDYVVTQNLSVADAAEHLRGNPHYQRFVDPLIDESIQPEKWFTSPWWQRIVRLFDRQLVLTLLLSTVTFGLWTYFRGGPLQRFLRVAAWVVVPYLALNALVIASGIVYLLRDGMPLVQDWNETALADLHARTANGGSAWGALKIFRLALVSFPYVALGLSGFELSMTVAPLVQGHPDDNPDAPRGRIRNVRKLLFTAAAIMTVGLLGSVTVAGLLIPQTAFEPGGHAVHRALAYLAHGGRLADGHPGSELNFLFGPAFGTVYDLCSIAILCLAGACVAYLLREYVPEYLNRFGMEVDLAHRIGVRLRFFYAIVLVVVILFHAEIAALQWVYVTSVMVLLSTGSLAALVALREAQPLTAGRRLLTVPFTLDLIFFLSMLLLTFAISRAGLEIALAFGTGILGTSFVSRWFRSTELRFQGFDFADDESRRLWEAACAHDFQLLVPHRPGMHSRIDKQKTMRTSHRLGEVVPIILIEAHLGDPSDFYQKPLMRVVCEDGVELIEVSRCVSTAHVLAAIALEMAKVGQPPELHFGWSDESPIAANVNFLLFGEGNVPWMVRELIRRAEPDPARRPRVVIG